MEDNKIKYTASQIQAERLRREKLKREEFRKQFDIDSEESFWKYCKYIDPEFFNDDKTLLRRLCNILQKVAQGILKKVIISMMPRSGKSYTVSLWCTWMLGHNPTGSIMRNSYGSKPSNKFSYDIRKIIGEIGEKKSEITKKYLKIFPNVKLSKDKRSVEEWALASAKESSYFCGSVGGAITGFGCNLAAILDDPIKDSKEAGSDSMLESIEEWYLSTHKTRIELGSGCPEIIIMTRWSINDTAGKRLLKEGDNWEQFVFPALDENGKSVCEAMASTEELLNIKAGMVNSGMEHVWEALYMCNPIEKKGLLFPKDQLQTFKLQDLPKIPMDIGYVDFADRGEDYLASIIGRQDGDFIYIYDIVFTKRGVEESEPMVTAQYLQRKPAKAQFESNNGGRIFALNIKKNINQYVNTSISWVSNTSHKGTRIMTWAGVIKERFKFLDESEYDSGSDYDLFMKNITSYKKEGTNKNDDAADCAAGLASISQGIGEVLVSVY